MNIYPPKRDMIQKRKREMKHYRIMTLNILNNRVFGYGKMRFERRIAAIEEMIRETEPDLIGVQELTKGMMPLMKPIFETYGMCGESRHSRINNEYTVILYRKEKFELIREQTYWLSDTPELPGSRVSMSQFPRTVSFALLKDRSSDTELSFFCTHLDLNFASVRRRQAQVLRNLILEHHRGSFTVVCGDFNDVKNSDALCAVYEAGLRDTSDDSLGSTLRERGGSARYHNRPIDHILISDEIKEYAVTKIDGKYGGCAPSDHYPLLAEIAV